MIFGRLRSLIITFESALTLADITKNFFADLIKSPT